MNITDFTYEQAQEYILEIPRFTHKNDMAATKGFLKTLGSPQKNQKIIHIAGTNGKGSVCAYLCSVLEEAGYGTGMFTSPHLVEMRERFRVRGSAVSEEQFLRAFKTVAGHLEPGGYHPSFFEFLFFMAMLIFQEENVQYTVLETGLGGRLDATNSIENPVICVITRIGLDHMEYLGNTVAQIAEEKAGIIKEGVPVAYFAGCEEAAAVIAEKAREMGCKAVPVGEQCDAISKNKNKTIDFLFHSRYYGYIRLTLSTPAPYQAENAAVALRALEELGIGFTRKQVEDGIRKAHWAGRMEEVLPGIWIDGAHNEDGVRAFLEAARTDECTGRRLLLFSAVQDKNYRKMFAQLMGSGLFGQAAAAPLENARSLTLQELKALSETSCECRCLVFPSVEEAFLRMRDLLEEEDRLYIVGSLYLAGQVKTWLRRHLCD